MVKYPQRSMTMTNQTSKETTSGNSNEFVQRCLKDRRFREATLLAVNAARKRLSKTDQFKGRFPPVSVGEAPHLFGIGRE
jgi:hypothetical protein